MPSPDTDAAATPRRSTLTLWLILAVSVAPIAASYIAFYFWQPSAHVNYGELLEPQLLPQADLTLQDGRPFRFSELKGEWVFLVADQAGCDEACRKKLTYIRQVRLTQPKDSARIERVWLVTDAAAPDPALIADHPGLIIVRAGTRTIVDALPAAGSAHDHIYVVDPLGNLMMRFPRDPDPTRVINDLRRLLRASSFG